MRLLHTRSEELLRSAAQYVAGGESSSARISPDHVPTVIVSGEGSRMTDADGNTYVDFQAAYGPLLFGHRHPRIVEAVREQLENRGTLFAMPHPLNEEVGKRIVGLVPGIQRLRFANSGTEAMISTVRLARAATGRELILKFEGHYHGWGDALFAKLHPSLEELGPEDSPTVTPRMAGVSPDCLGGLIQRSWNRRDLVEAAMEQFGDRVACILCEPVMGNSGVVPPDDGFLTFLREIADQYGALLVFDEVITGFRVAPGGAQDRFGVVPDLTVVAKAVGGGLPVAAFGGREDLMELLIDGRAFHGGTYSGNPLALAGANAALDMIAEGGATLYDGLDHRGEALAQGLRDAAAAAALPAVVNRVGPMLQIFFVQSGVEELRSYRDIAAGVHHGRFAQFQALLQDRGIYVHPDQFECFFVTAAHSNEDIELAVEAAHAAAAELAAEGDA